jgi:endonuclease/exonuclease/phosphatase family metal-dependent hydrolase
LAGIADRPFDTTVMMGDFNEWSERGAVRRALARTLPARTRHRTFPARWPLLMLDRIYCRPHTAMVESWVDRQARTTSDHLPVIADIRLSGDRAAGEIESAVRGQGGGTG